MRCDEILTKAADLDGAPDPDVLRHLADCADCRDALADAASGRAAYVAFESSTSTVAPPADAASAWRGARSRRPDRVVRTVGRVAVVLLAAAGAAALAGVDLRISRGPELATRAGLDTALARIDARLDKSDGARESELKDLTVWLDDRRREDVDALVAQVVALRREVAAARLYQDSMAGGPVPPALPDPR